jgi:hypothetical protein
MKHRSVVIFIIIVAALAVAPQVAQQFEQLASNAASRVEGAMWNVFLSVNAQKFTGDNARCDAPILVQATQQQPACDTMRGQAPTPATRANLAPARNALNLKRTLTAETPSPLLAKNSFKPFVLDFQTEVNPHLSLKSLPQVNLSLPAPVAKVAALRLREDGREILRVVARLKDDETREEALSRLEQLVERRVREGNVRFELRHKAGGEWIVEPQEGKGAPALPARAQKAKAQAKGACPTIALEMSPPASFVNHGAIGVSDSF